jgi:tagatose 1,6-diphosphate aldolase GatY/KbaY
VTVVSFTELLAEHRDRGTGLGAFTCYDLETAQGVLAAAAERGSAALLLVSTAALVATGANLIAALRSLTERSPVRACIQLDHASDLELMAGALEAGAGAIMADGSQLGFEENIELVAAAAQLAGRYGAAVEAELGYVSGEEDVSVDAGPGELTDPAQAAAFVQRSGAACLAVSIGNVHGTSSRTPTLDWERLAAIRRAIEAPLSLHGASGLPDETITRAISHGITKINVNTELRAAYLRATADTLAADRTGHPLLALHQRQSAAVQQVAEQKLSQYEGDHR